MSKKRFIWQRSLSAGLSVLLCLSMLPVAALAEEPATLFKALITSFRAAAEMVPSSEAVA